MRDKKISKDVFFFSIADHNDYFDKTKMPGNLLYKHVLGVIFGFMSLNELSRMLQVSHLWSSAVETMSALGAECPSFLVRSHERHLGLCLSRVARHVGALGTAGCCFGLDFMWAHLLALYLPGLQTLRCKLSGNFRYTPIIFSPSLTRLEVHLPPSEPPCSVLIHRWTAEPPTTRNLCSNRPRSNYESCPLLCS